MPLSAPVKCRGCGDVRATSCGSADCPVPLQVSGHLDPEIDPLAAAWTQEFEDARRAQEREDDLMARAARGEPFWRDVQPVGSEVHGLLSYGPTAHRERVVRTDPLGRVTDPIFELASAVFECTGRHGITRISLTPDLGLALGIAPGSSVDVQTPVGRVEVYAERTARAEGVVQIDGTEANPVVDLEPRISTDLRDLHEAQVSAFADVEKRYADFKLDVAQAVLRFRDSEHATLLGMLKDAVPVLEAAIAHAELHDGPPSALVEAVRAFGGGGLHGIELADGHLAEVRSLIDLIETRTAVAAPAPKTT